MAATKVHIKPCENWLRVFVLIGYGGRELCCDVLFNKEKWPTDGVELYKKLKPHESNICRFPNQFEILCPSSGSTDYNKFDLTLFTSIIQNRFGRKYESLVQDLRRARNKECHRANIELSDPEFNQLWKCTTDMLENHGFDVTTVDALKSGDSFLDQRIIYMAIFEGRLIFALIIRMANVML